MKCSTASPTSDRASGRAQTQALYDVDDEVVRSLHWRVLWPARQSALFQSCQEITHHAQGANSRIDSFDSYTIYRCSQKLTNKRVNSVQLK